MSELTVIEINPDQAPALYAPNGLDAYIEQIKAAVNEVPDLTTKKGRDRVASLAASVSRSKTAIEKPGREYLKRLKEAVKPAEQEIKRFVDACDELRDLTRKPLTEWEEEQARLAAEFKMNAMHEEAIQINEEFDRRALERFESDHEMALLMNDAFDREQKEKAAEAERQRIAHEEELKHQAAEQAKREAAEAAQREIDAAAAREREALLAKERAEREAKEAAELSERNRIAAEQKAEREKQEAIEAEKRKAQAEADRIKREAAEKESVRLEEERHVADEKAKREADVEHRRTINREIVSMLVDGGVTEEMAILCVKAIASGKSKRVNINY